MLARSVIGVAVIFLSLAACRKPAETNPPRGAEAKPPRGAPPTVATTTAASSDADEDDEVEEVPFEEVALDGDVPMGRTGSERIDSSKLKPVADGDAVQISPAEAKAAAIYSPAPRREWLEETAAAKSKRPVKGVVRYCINEHGRTLGIETRTPGDPEVDRVLRDTIASWRFRPIERDGKRLVCTTETFDVRFE